MKRRRKIPARAGLHSSTVTGGAPFCFSPGGIKRSVRGSNRSSAAPGCTCSSRRARTPRQSTYQNCAASGGTIQVGSMIEAISVQSKVLVLESEIVLVSWRAAGCARCLPLSSPRCRPGHRTETVLVCDSQKGRYLAGSISLRTPASNASNPGGSGMPYRSLLYNTISII